MITAANGALIFGCRSAHDHDRRQPFANAAASHFPVFVNRCVGTQQAQPTPIK
jgi:hypothetical protein